jgi:hypothetical protein
MLGKKVWMMILDPRNSQTWRFLSITITEIFILTLAWQKEIGRQILSMMYSLWRFPIMTIPLPMHEMGDDLMKRSPAMLSAQTVVNQIIYGVAS